MAGNMKGAKVTANRRRGEIVALFDGQPLILCLTLGALAELESAFGVSNLNELGDKFAGGRLSASDLVAVIGAGLRGGGNLISDQDVQIMSTEGGAAGFARIAAELLLATFGTAQDLQPPAGSRPDVVADAKAAAMPDPRLPQAG